MIFLFRFIIPIIGLSINIFSQIFCFRCRKSIGLLKSIFSGFIAGFFCVILLEVSVFFNALISWKDAISFSIVNMIIYFFLSYCFFHFINLGETARRIRILREIQESRCGLSMNEILMRYNAEEIIEKRLNRLINNGQIIYKSNKYFIGKPMMLLIAMVIRTIKLILIGRKSEFDVSSGGV
jgi:hypothetical protein